jgi:protein TonB
MTASGLLHVLVIAAVVVLSARQETDEVLAPIRVVFYAAAAPPPPPPPPPPLGGGAARARPKRIPVPVVTSEIRAPVKREEPREPEPKREFEPERPPEPQETPEPEPVMDEPAAEPVGGQLGGVVGGQLGGVVGGQLGGVVGGQLGGVLGGSKDGKVGGQLPPPPAVDKPVRLSRDMTPARPVRQVAPEYPRLARQARIEGTVTLMIVVDVKGRVSEARYVKGPDILAQAAMAAVKQWIYEPTRLRDGRPVAAYIVQPILFRLTDSR